MDNIQGDEIPKKKRGNPNFQKGKRNDYYPKKESVQESGKMSEQATPTQSPDPQPMSMDQLDINIFSDSIASEELPLDDDVVKKDYATIKDTTAPSGGNTPPPTNPVGGNTTTPSDPSAPPPSNEPLGQPQTSQPSDVKTPEQLRFEAEQIVDMMLRGYDKVHALGRYVGKVDDNKLAQEHLAGNIDLNMTFPIGKKNVSVKEFFADYNENIDENIVVTDEFKNNIKPPMVRIALKRGWGLSDEMTVAIMLAEDLGTKASLLMGLKKSANLVMEACMEIMKKQKVGNEPPPKPKEEEPTVSNEDNWHREEATIID